MLNIRSIFVGIVAVICLVAVIWAGEKKESAKIECIWEKKFDFLPNLEERRASGITIRGYEVIFDDAEVSAKEAKDLAFRGYEKVRDNEKVIIPYPKVMIGRSNIIFLDVRGNIERKYYLGEWAEVGFSKNEKFIGILGLGKKKKERIFTMLDRDGNVLWKTDITRVGYTLPYISPDGEYVIAEGDPSYDLCDYYPSIWDKNGLVKGLFEEDTKAEIEEIDFTEDGKHFVISYEICSVETTNKMIKTATGEELPYLKLKKSTNINLFTEDGKNLWSKQFKKINNSGLAISPKGNYIAFVSSLKGSLQMDIYNREGSLLQQDKVTEDVLDKLLTSNNREIWYILFSPNLMEISSYNKILVPEKIIKSQGKLFHHYKIKKICHDSEFEYFLSLVLKYKKRHQRQADVLYLFDKEKKTLWKKQYAAYSLCAKYQGEGAPTFTVMSDKIMVFNHSEKKIECYRINNNN